MVRPNSDRTALDGVPVEFVDGDLATPESLLQVRMGPLNSRKFNHTRLRAHGLPRGG